MHSDTLIQFIKFGIVGLSNTLLGYVIYVVTLRILRAAQVFPEADIFLAQLVMFLLSVLWSFYWNNRMVFKRLAACAAEDLCFLCLHKSVFK